MAGNGTPEQTGDSPLTGDTLLLRQVPPGWIQDCRVTSQLFKLTTKDGKRLSAYDNRVWTAAESWEFHVAQGWQSVGVLAVSVEECQLRGLSVCRDDVHFIGHTSICFEPMSRSAQARIAEELTRVVQARGWIHKDANYWKE